MLTYLRYALATVCFAASVGCLALWWRSMYRWDIHEWLTEPPFCGQIFQIIDGTAVVEFNHQYSYPALENGRYFHTSIRANGQFNDRLEDYGSFSLRGMKAHFPLWYPALVFALAGVIALRLGRRFTLRSAIIATTVVAGLLGMAVVL